MADILTLKKFEALSPFEIKDELINLAKETSKRSQSAFLNAGRGNPNWIATTPREGFFLLGQFAITESKRVMEHPAGVGGGRRRARQHRLQRTPLQLRQEGLYRSAGVGHRDRQEGARQASRRNGT